MEPKGVGQAGNFHWWEGVVENNRDPSGAGRCQVRVIAHNTPVKEDLPTSSLPWAYPVMPLNSPQGKVVALKPGTRVFGFYRDGLLGQDLVMVGTINIGYESPGKYDNYNEDEDPVTTINLAEPTPRIGPLGFADDREGTGGPIPTEPKKTKVTVDPDTRHLMHEDISDYGALQENEINTPRLQRGIPQGTMTAAHALARSIITRPDGSKSYEPPNPFAAQYPFNTVEESDSGHLREIDDTPEHERIKEAHRTGTFYEIHPDGTKVTKVVKDDFSVTIGDKGVKVQGICAVHVVGKADFYCEEDIYVKTDKTARVVALKDAHVNATENITATAGKDVTATAGKDVQVSGAGHVAVVSGGNMSISAGGEITFADSSATASNVDEIIKDIVDGKGGASIRVDSGA